MKMIKNILLIAVLLAGGVMNTSCTDYQDEIDALDYRVTVLEELVKRVNTNLDALSVIVTVMEDGDYITNVRETEYGYLINFANNGPIQIYDGKDGLNGKDAEVPDITVVKDPTDGNWYWQLNGTWLVIDGNKVRANGKDGKDGKDAVSPQVRINPETGIWEISTDEGQTWTSTGTSAKGRDGRDGENGKNGKDGNQYIADFRYQIGADGSFVVITTADGSTFKIPIKQ